MTASTKKLVLPSLVIAIGILGLVASAIWLVVLGLRADAGASPAPWDGWAQFAVAIVVLAVGIVWLILAGQRGRRRG